MTITFPLPTIHSVPSLIPSVQFPAELELLKNPLQLNKWLDYINVVKESVRTNELASRGEGFELDSTTGLDGRLSTPMGREGLKRMVDVYERALSHFPTSFTLWSHYLATRSGYILGTATQTLKLNAPKSNYAQERSMNDYLRAGKGQVPELEAGERDVESGWTTEDSLNSLLGFDEWRSLVAVHERALMWLPNVRLFFLVLSSLYHH